MNLRGSKWKTGGILTALGALVLLIVLVASPRFPAPSDAERASTQAAAPASSDSAAIGPGDMPASPAEAAEVPLLAISHGMESDATGSGSKGASITEVPDGVALIGRVAQTDIQMGKQIYTSYGFSFTTPDKDPFAKAARKTVVFNGLEGLSIMSSNGSVSLVALRVGGDYPGGADALAWAVARASESEPLLHEPIDTGSLTCDVYTIPVNGGYRLVGCAGLPDGGMAVLVTTLLGSDAISSAGPYVNALYAGVTAGSRAPINVAAPRPAVEKAAPAAGTAGATAADTGTAGASAASFAGAVAALGDVEAKTPPRTVTLTGRGLDYAFDMPVDPLGLFATGDGELLMLDEATAAGWAWTTPDATNGVVLVCASQTGDRYDYDSVLEAVQVVFGVRSVVGQTTVQCPEGAVDVFYSTPAPGDDPQLYTFAGGLRLPSGRLAIITVMLTPEAFEDAVPYLDAIFTSIQAK